MLGIRSRDRDSDLGGGRHALHDGRRHVGGRLHRRRAARRWSAVGLAVALPVALDAVGGLGRGVGRLCQRASGGAALLPPLTATGTLWTRQAIVSWWDVSAMLMLGGIPWNCYFQRVLSCRTPASGAAAFDLLGPADDRADRAAAAARPGGVRVSVAAGSGGAAGEPAGRCRAADLQVHRRRRSSGCSASRRSSAR